MIVLSLLLSLVACKEEPTGSFDLEQSPNQYGLTKAYAPSSADMFANKYCVTSEDTFGTDQVDSQVAQGGGVFNLDTGECTYGQNLFGKMYPASTTKILTCLIALEQGDLNRMVTVSEHAADQSSDSSVANLRAGDIISLKDLLYGLMLRSGNDAAIAIGEALGGSEEGVATMMNAKAQEVGATHSHFSNPHGLHQKEHYTTVYDMYLIFQEAIKNEAFVEIISTPNYHVNYTNQSGESKEQDWHNTNRYLLGKEKAPEGFTVIGGKTGTTYEAGYCLVLYSLNQQKQPIISIVYYADCSLNLYYLMNQLLRTYGNAP